MSYSLGDSAFAETMNAIRFESKEAAGDERFVRIGQLTSQPNRILETGTRSGGVTAYINDDGSSSFGSSGVTTFVGLTDTPASYSAAGGKILQVNGGASAVEFSSDPSLTTVTTTGAITCGTDLTVTGHTTLNGDVTATSGITTLGAALFNVNVLGVFVNNVPNLVSDNINVTSSLDTRSASHSVAQVEVDDEVYGSIASPESLLSVFPFNEYNLNGEYYLTLVAYNMSTGLTRFTVSTGITDVLTYYNIRVFMNCVFTNAGFEPPVFDGYRIFPNAADSTKFDVEYTHSNVPSGSGQIFKFCVELIKSGNT